MRRPPLHFAGVRPEVELARRFLQWDGVLGDKSRAKRLLLDAVAKDYTPAFAVLGDFLSEFEQDTEAAAKMFLEQRRDEAFDAVNAIHSTVFSKDALPRVLPSSLCDTIKAQAERVVAEYQAEQKRWDEVRALSRKAEA